MKEHYLWKMKTSSPRVQWVEKDFRNRDSLGDYLRYFGIDQDYKGPGSYVATDGYTVSIEVKRTEE